MKTSKIGFWTIAALAASMLAAPAAYSQTERFSASLIGANEVPPINTAGTADFDMTIQPSGITFSLNFSDLSSPLAVAHLHFGPSKVNGGVMIFLCVAEGSRIVQRPLQELSPERLRRQMSPGLSAKALP